jgi:DNA modification methylase
MKIEKRKIADLSQDPANVRKHPEKNLDAIIASLRRFGQQHPIVIDVNNTVRAGNGRLQAAIALGWDEIDCVVTELKGSEAIAYAIADNRTAELAEWDDDMLAAQLHGLLTDDEALLEAAGFDEDELAAMLDELEGDGTTGDIVEDEVPEPPADPITKPGDLWILGEHRLLCGDSTKAEDVARLMGGAKADLCFTSPPYGQQRDYTKEGKEKCQDWDGLMQGVFANLPMLESGQVLVNLGLIHRDGEWIPYWDAWIAWMREQGWRRFGWYVWDQTYGLPGDWQGRLAPSHEFVFHFNRKVRRPQKWIEKHEENVVMFAKERPLRRKDGRTESATSPESGMQTHKIPDSVIRECRQQSSAGIPGEGHPAPFSKAFASHGIKTWTIKGESAYEPFCGSGTTLIAAEQLGRKCYGMEISPQYCDVIVKRWENLTGQKAVCQSATPA